MEQSQTVKTETVAQVLFTRARGVLLAWQQVLSRAIAEQQMQQQQQVLIWQPSICKMQP
ncbi:hypothetical protein L195_g034281 [Trifolium pratense]|uniref:Uncharacterized protein n=1 Tax=Trifolium pratense TaxID=57577 RepID=A0A2K3LIE3_TRIPR|nr:hypothetical protein L195_g034281 [Trifolium pratense]